MFHSLKRKQLILVRHANTLTHDEFDGADFDLPLSEKWKDSVTIVSRYLRLIGLKPEMIIASPSKRTKETALLMSREFNISNVDFVDNLYNRLHHADARDSLKTLLDLIRQTPESTKVLMLVGHNDDILPVAQHLTDEWIPTMKKWSLVVLSLPEEADWKDASVGDLSMVYYLTPQFLKLEALS